VASWEEIESQPMFREQCSAVARHLAAMIITTSDDPEAVSALLADRVSTIRVEPGEGGVAVCWYAGTRFMVLLACFVSGAPVSAVETMDLIFGDPHGDLAGG
jgi:hypothetical protein